MNYATRLRLLTKDFSSMVTDRKSYSHLTFITTVSLEKGAKQPKHIFRKEFLKTPPEKLARGKQTVRFTAKPTDRVAAAF